MDKTCLYSNIHPTSSTIFRSENILIILEARFTIEDLAYVTTNHFSGSSLENMGQLLKGLSTGRGGSGNVQIKQQAEKKVLLNVISDMKISGYLDIFI